MRQKLAFLFLLLFAFFLRSWSAHGWTKWEYTNPNDLEVSIKPDQPEFHSGEVCTFTITVRNKTDKPVKLSFRNGQRWDLAIFHEPVQIWRWSQGMTWDDTPHNIEVLPNKPETVKMSWLAIDRNGAPLPRGLYRAEGMLMIYPRYLVTNKTDFHLVPAKIVNKGVFRVKVNQIFEIQLPRFGPNTELQWRTQYVYNDNRIKPVLEKREGEKILRYFKAYRRGHVIMHFHAYNQYKEWINSIERVTYRIEIFETHEQIPLVPNQKRMDDQ